MDKKTTNSCPTCGGSGWINTCTHVDGNGKSYPCPACQKPEGEAELKCGCGGNVKIEPSDNGRGLDSTCFFINCENENCPLHDNDIFYDTESEAISAFRLATNQAKLDAQEKEIKRLRHLGCGFEDCCGFCADLQDINDMQVRELADLKAENVKLRLIVFGYYDQFKNDMGICGLNTEAKEILKGGE